MNGEYEALCAAISHIDAATAAIDDAGFFDDHRACQVSRVMHGLRDNLNNARVELLGNGKGRPFYVAEMLAKQST
jgi:hypothetical protein